MKKIQIKLLGVSLLLMVMVFSSCTNDLDQSPEGNTAVPGDEFFQTPASYKQFLSKLYAGFATSGQTAAGSPDISGIDEGEAILQKSFDITEDDTPETIAEKVHLIEYEIFPIAINKVLNNN